MIYDNIKNLCKKKNLSIRQVEEKAGVANGIIGSWRTSIPRTDNLQKVADVLGVSISTLLKEPKKE